MNDHLNQLLTKLYEAQKLKGTNAAFEIFDALDKHLDAACKEHDALMFEASGKQERLITWLTEESNDATWNPSERGIWGRVAEAIETGEFGGYQEDEAA